MLRAKRHRRRNVEIPADGTVCRVPAMLLFGTLDNDISPWACDYKISEGTAGFGAEAARGEWDVLLVFEGNTGSLQLQV